MAGLLFGGLGWGVPTVAQELSEEGLRQVRAILAEKAARTPTEKKLDTSLLYARRESLGQAMVQASRRAAGSRTGPALTPPAWQSSTSGPR